MFLTVYLSNNDQHFSEVPITPDTLCRDVVELCKESGEADCHLAETWRGSGRSLKKQPVSLCVTVGGCYCLCPGLSPERAVGDGERMVEVLQRWGQQRGEVRYLLRHQRAPGRESGKTRLTPKDRQVVRSVPPNGEDEPWRLLAQYHLEQSFLTEALQGSISTTRCSSRGNIYSVF